MKYNRREISKMVKVSDPENWYNQKTVKVSLFICPEYKGKTEIRILVESIDDFAMAFTRNCYSQADIYFSYKLMKENLFDKLPRKISCKWLVEHGYFPFQHDERK